MFTVSGFSPSKARGLRSDPPLKFVSPHSGGTQLVFVRGSTYIARDEILMLHPMIDILVEIPGVIDSSDKGESSRGSDCNERTSSSEVLK
jgi:hypothetical protein